MLPRGPAIVSRAPDTIGAPLQPPPYPPGPPTTAPLKVQTSYWALSGDLRRHRHNPRRSHHSHRATVGLLALACWVGAKTLTTTAPQPLPRAGVRHHPVLKGVGALVEEPSGEVPPHAVLTTRLVARTLVAMPVVPALRPSQRLRAVGVRVQSARVPRLQMPRPPTWGRVVFWRNP